MLVSLIFFEKLYHMPFKAWGFPAKLLAKVCSFVFSGFQNVFQGPMLLSFLHSSFNEQRSMSTPAALLRFWAHPAPASFWVHCSDLWQGYCCAQSGQTRQTIMSLYLQPSALKMQSWKLHLQDVMQVIHFCWQSPKWHRSYFFFSSSTLYWLFIHHLGCSVYFSFWWRFLICDSTEEYNLQWAQIKRNIIRERLLKASQISGQLPPQHRKSDTNLIIVESGEDRGHSRLEVWFSHLSTLLPWKNITVHRFYSLNLAIYFSSECKDSARKQVI